MNYTVNNFFLVSSGVYKFIYAGRGSISVGQISSRSINLTRRTLYIIKSFHGKYSMKQQSLIQELRRKLATFNSDLRTGFKGSVPNAQHIRAHF